MCRGVFTVLPRETTGLRAGNLAVANLEVDDALLTDGDSVADDASVAGAPVMDVAAFAAVEDFLAGVAFAADVDFLI